MSLEVLVSAPYFLPVLDRFRATFDACDVRLRIATVKERLSEQELMAYAGQIDGALCGDDAFTARVLRAAAPRLRVISKWGTGIDSIDREEALKLGIAVFNTPGAFTQAVADSVLGGVLAFARRIPWADREMKAGAWSKPLARALHECTLGVVGVGAIGKAVLRRAVPFGMRLLGNDIVALDPDFVAEVGLQVVSLERLLAESDFVSLNCDLNPTSRGLINGRALKRMKPTAVLINSSRGPVVEEAALVAALQAGWIAGAALDVFVEDPLPSSSPLRSMENVLLSPHNSNSSPEAWERVHRNTVENLLRGLGVDWPTSGRAAGGDRSAAPGV